MLLLDPPDNVLLTGLDLVFNKVLIFLIDTIFLLGSLSEVNIKSILLIEYKYFNFDPSIEILYDAYIYLRLCLNKSL